jgi:hypothetical protein
VPKSTKLKVAWEYKCEDYRYEFSNDAYKAANEQFHVIYEKNAPSAEDLQGYKDGIKESDEYNSDDNITIIEKEKRVINHFIVTLDNNLFFNIIDKFEEQYEWTDISADELIGIFEFIRKKYKEIFG